MPLVAGVVSGVRSVAGLEAGANVLLRMIQSPPSRRKGDGEMSRAWNYSLERGCQISQGFKLATVNFFSCLDDLQNVRIKS